MTEAEQSIRDRGLVLILKELHDTIDRLVAEAYGWPADLSDEDILGRLVALNKERAEEERRGIVRWLRPEYQIPKFGTPKEKAEQIEAELPEVAAAAAKPSFPASEVGRTAAVFAMLARQRTRSTLLRLLAEFQAGAPRGKAGRGDAHGARPHGPSRLPGCGQDLRPASHVASGKCAGFLDRPPFITTANSDAVVKLYPVLPHMRFW